MDGQVPLEVFERSRYAVLLADVNGRVRLCNPVAAGILGCSADGAVGAACWKVAGFFGMDRAPLCTPFCPVQRQIAAGQSPSGRRVTLDCSRSDECPYELLTFPIPPPGRQRHAVLHIILPTVPFEETPSPPIVDPSSSHRGHLECLTKREREILELLALGLSTPAIASRLFISPVTVSNHLQHVMRKLEVHRRLDAVLTLLGQR